MTYAHDFTLPAELLEQIATEGFEVLPGLIRVVVNAAMQAERQEYLRAAPYQHTPDRRDQANGYKPKTVKTRVGEITFAIPQVREGGFYPQALEKGLRRLFAKEDRAGGLHEVALTPNAFQLPPAPPIGVPVRTEIAPPHPTEVAATLVGTVVITGVHCVRPSPPRFNPGRRLSMLAPYLILLRLTGWTTGCLRQTLRPHFLTSSCLPPPQFRQPAEQQGQDDVQGTQKSQQR